MEDMHGLHVSPHERESARAFPLNQSISATDIAIHQSDLGKISFPPYREIPYVHLQSANQIFFPPDREIPLVHLQSANQILFPPVREIRLVRMQRPAFTPITLCTTGRPLCWYIAICTVVKPALP